MMRAWLSRSALRNCWRRLSYGRMAAGLLFAGAVALGSPALQKANEKQPAAQPAGLQIVQVGGEPELRVDGMPFFIQAAQFDYFRIPPHLWQSSLERYRELGINTIDLRIPWNWHEPSEGAFDFEGTTNPRRNLRKLLRLIGQMRLKLVARPGPIIGDDWLNGGYPGWMLANSKLSKLQIEEGAPPPEAEMAALDANAAAREWLADENQMKRARHWMTEVARELAAYSADRFITISEPGEHEGETEESKIGGPLLFVVLGDRFSISPRSGSADLDMYLAELRGALAQGGLTSAAIISVPRAGVQGVAPMTGFSSPNGGNSPLGIAGQWFVDPPGENPTTQKLLPVHATLPVESSSLTPADASSLALLVGSLATQPGFPPYLSAFAPTTHAPRGDIRSVRPPLENMLLASRILIGAGARALTYTPLQDSLTPAGWETSAAPRYLRWDSALDLAGNSRPLAGSVSRNGQLVTAWGAMLASSHLRADFGIVDLRGSLVGTSAEENSEEAGELRGLFRLAQLSGFTPELVNPDAQTPGRLLRDRVILLGIPGKQDHTLVLTEKAQATIADFVRRGGTLICLPSRPAGSLLEPLWKGAPEAPSSGANFSEWDFEQGRIIASSTDFIAGIRFTENAEQDPVTREIQEAIDSLSMLLTQSGVVRTVQRPETEPPEPNLVISQLISNRAANVPAANEACPRDHLCAAALISVTNLSPDREATGSLEILDPIQPPEVNRPARVPLKLTIPPHESLLLPLHAALCSSAGPGETCSDEVISAGAELLGAVRDNKTMELTFYVPTRATVSLHLDSAPLKAELDGDIRPDSQWKQESGEFEATLLRGAAPDYRRVLRLQMRYAPRLPEKPNPAKIHHSRMQYRVLDAVRVPLGDGVSIPTGPPLLLADASTGGKMVIESWNHSEDARKVDFELEGAFRGSVFQKIYGGDQAFARLRFQPSRDPAPKDKPVPSSAGDILQGNLTIRSAREQTSGAIAFLAADQDGNSHYEFDFDLDGAPERVLESDALRVIISPADSGRAFALIDKATNDDLITLGGAFHDFLAPAGGATNETGNAWEFAFNRAYDAEWIEEKAEGKKDAGLRLNFRASSDSTGGLQVEKTLRLPAPETVEAVYRVSAEPAEGENGSASTGEDFVSGLSIPMPATEETNLRICWEPHPAPRDGDPAASEKVPAEPHCEEITPAGRTISLPEEITRVEIVSPGRRGFTAEWTSGHVTVVPKLSSAEVNFAVPAPMPGDPAEEFTLRYTIHRAGK